MLRLLREPRTGKPGPGARLIALVIVLGLLAVTGPALFVILHRLLQLVG